MKYESLNSREISILLARQLDMNSHPYTCNNGHVLYPSATQWVCPKCEYYQKYGIIELEIIRYKIKHHS